MPRTRPRLITFAISHYCEKARWALDWHGIDYQEVAWPPGFHRILAKRAGAKRGSVPILLSGTEVIEGSDTIIDWAEQNSDGSRPHLCPTGQSNEIREIEDRLGRKTGINVRRFIYSHVFPGKGHYVKPMLFADTSFAHRAIGNLMWPTCQKLIIKGYKLNENSIAESRTILEEEFNWLEDKLGEGRSYFAGKTFSRADLTAASLLAPFARPDEMPLYRDALFPDELMRSLDEFSTRPIMTWARKM